MKKHQDLTGIQFGNLTVIEETGQRKDRYVLWRCRCVCGKDILANTRELKRGTVKSCGCITESKGHRGCRAENLAGKRYGSLTVLYRIENQNGRTCWMCRCDCGREISMTARNLTAGYAKSCGCRKEERKTTALDLSNQRFGRLTALCPTAKRDHKGSIYWKCRCDCGNEVEVSADRLLHGNYQSCGCLREQCCQDIHNQLHFVDGTCVEWLEKRRHRSDNTSGFRGVSRNQKGQFRTSIGFKGKRYYIGTFREFSDAVQARLEVENLLHDGFVRAYRLWQKHAQENPLWGEENPFVFDVEKQGGDFRINTNMEFEE